MVRGTHASSDLVDASGVLVLGDDLEIRLERVVDVDAGARDALSAVVGRAAELLLEILFAAEICVEDLVVEHLRVQRDGAGGDEGGGKDHGRDDRELDSGDVEDCWSDRAVIGVADGVHVSPQEGLGNGIDDDICAAAR